MNEPLPERRNISLHPGISILILLFLILGLVSFSALSASTSKSDASLSAKQAALTGNWYQARNSEQAWLAATDAALHTARSASAAEQEYYKKAGADSTGHTLEKDFPMGDGQQLVCRIRVLFPEDPDGSCYVLLTEKAVSTAGYSYDNSITVFDPSGEN